MENQAYYVTFSASNTKEGLNNLSNLLAELNKRGIEAIGIAPIISSWGEAASNQGLVILTRNNNK
jgi:hypothetical protein